MYCEMAKRKHCEDADGEEEVEPSLIALVVDTETTGLPQRPPWGSCTDPVPQDLEMYDGVRIVSIAWIVRDLGSGADLGEGYYVVKPEGFVVPLEATEVHGITHAYAEEHGKPLGWVLDRLKEDVERHGAGLLVAHNLAFDIRVIKSELYRADRMDVMKAIKGMQPICTMRRSRVVMRCDKMPKLVELYAHCFPEREMPHAHNALHDARHCCECLQWMVDQHSSSRYLGESLWT